MKFNPLVPELLVHDIRESVAFYVDLLGFNVNYSRPESKFYFLEREGAQIMIQQLVPTERFTNTLPEKPFGRGMNFEIDTKDANALYTHIQGNHYPIFCPIEEQWYRTGDVLSGNRQFVVADPSGYLLRFRQNLGTKPLDKKAGIL